MSILIDKTTRILVQGITTIEGRQHTSLMLENKSEIVAGVSPGRYGQEVMGVPVYDKVSEAVKRHPVDLSVIFVPKNSVLQAALEAMEEGIKTLVIVTGEIPVTETLKMKSFAKKKGVMIFGPGSAGVLIPGVCKVGTLTNEYVLKGEVGVIARTKGNEKKICQSLYKEEIGASAIVSLGGEDIIGMGFDDLLEFFEDDEQTQIVVIGGETAGRMEEDAARYVAESNYPKPVIAYIFDKEKNPETANEKEKALRESGITVVEDIWEIGQIIKESTVEESGGPPKNGVDNRPEGS
jgi:succinyl-CoA synthetase alpha subunit